VDPTTEPAPAGLSVPSAAELLARCRFPPPGAPACCAVSGGADSTALLVLAVAAGCAVTAVHVDHGLRPDSHREAEVVAANAARLGAAFRGERVAVARGPNLEARARAARHEVLGPDALLGHTADDQAETVLLNLMRGAGLEGLAGINDDARHPILGLRRRETVDLCSAAGLEVVVDESNADPAHARNRVRHEVLPLLAEVARRDIVPLLVRTAGHARAAVELLEQQAGDLDPTSARELASAPPLLARMALRRWLRDTSAERHPPDAAAVDRVLSVARGDVVATEIAGGWRVARRQGRLRREAPAEQDQ
jgi:tRNA(Ile)-lysidine synthase